MEGLRQCRRGPHSTLSAAHCCELVLEGITVGSGWLEGRDMLLRVTSPGVVTLRCAGSGVDLRLSLSPGEQSPEAEVRHRTLSKQAAPQSQEEGVLRFPCSGDQQGSDGKKEGV